MNRVLLTAALAILWGTPLLAAPNLYDDFENGVGGDIVYAPWGNNPGVTTTPNGINNLITTATNEHSLSGNHSARVFASDPAAWNGYTDFGASTGFVRAEVYVYEDKSDPGTANPVTNMLSMYGDAANPGAFTDYMQVGVVPFYPAGSQGYGYRSATGGIQNANVARKSGWTKLAIEADALSAGGQVRFYIDDVQVGTSSRTSGVALRYVRLGNNSKSYENFWYDDLRVTPEPAALALVGLGGLMLRRRRNVA